MNTDILKQLFIELFQVNHIMMDLIFRFENTDNGDEILTGFYIEHITEEFEHKTWLLKYAEENPISCLNGISREERDGFLDSLYQ
jgi:hypothetical protein